MQAPHPMQVSSFITTAIFPPIHTNLGQKYSGLFLYQVFY